MTDYRRRKFPGGYYFFTAVTHQRSPFLITELARECLHQAWKEVQFQKPFTVVALCLMPDHLHCIWKLPQDDYNYSFRWAAVKNRFTRLWLAAGGRQVVPSDSRQKKREQGVWQRRFWEHQIRDWNDLAVHVKYIHRNPIKHGLVESLKDWPWSTWHKYEKGGFYLAEILDTIQTGEEELFVGE